MTTVGTRDVGTELAGRARQHGRQIEQVGLAVARDLDLAQALGMADHLVDGAEAQARHDLAQLLGNKEHKVLDVLWLAAEAATQAAVLRSDAGRAGILLAVALHEAAHGDERHGRKAKLLGTQQAGDGDIGAVHEPSASSTTRERRPFCSSVCWASARPSSSGRPACQIESRAAAPEPPLWPLIKILSAAPLATPVAMVPTPASLTSLTDTRAPGLAFLRSKISSARSSME